MSGGQQQRVALARALALEPAVLLLDEPLSNLDAKLREEMRQEIKSLVKRTGTTTLYVTHDQLEALTMADRIALMHQGKIDQQGEPREVYQRPATSFAAHFLGRTNIVDGVVERVQDASGTGRVQTQWGRIESSMPANVAVGAHASIGFRPESVVIVGADAPPEGRNVLKGVVTRRTFAGDMVEMDIDLGGRVLQARGDPYLAVAEQSTVYVQIPPERCYYLADSKTHAGSAEADPSAGVQPAADGTWLPGR
jgi:iron(III) transport system ATP-binding protein